MHYRKEIDGLRAVAVLPVILFHGDFSGFGGGYIGVDIFFVISGYLITSIILDEISKNQFSIINFYERRARRILPALSIVLIFTTILTYLFMPSDLLKIYSQSLISVALFVSNIFFYFTNNYFAATSDEMPLLHTWSLAVEEQYYVFFPIMIMLFWSFARKWLLASIIIIALISLICAQYLSSKHAINANFYLIISRAWELLFGSIIAFISLKDIKAPIKIKEMMSIIGLAMIAYSIIFFDKSSSVPNFYTLIPVVGTCLIIIFSTTESLVGRFLSHKIMVLVGLLSYSLYLWHQPLFSFLKMKSIGEPSTSMFLWAIFATFILSFASWKYIEKPFRNKTKYNQASIFRLSAVSIAVFFFIGLLGHINNGFENRFNLETYADSIKYSPKRDVCHTDGPDYLKPTDACEYFSKNITWASFGDSHIVEPTYALARKLEKYDIGLVHLSFSGCPLSLLFEVTNPGCTKWVNESIEYLERTPSIKNILIGFRYSAYLYGDQLIAYPNIPDEDPSIHFANPENGLSVEKSRLKYWQSFEKIIDRLLAAGKNVYILYPIPELPINIKKAITPYTIFGENTILDLHKSTTKEYYLNRNHFILNKLDALAYGNRLHAIKPFEAICSDDYCPAVIEGKALYFDDDHLSISGAELLFEKFIIYVQKPMENIHVKTIN